MLAFSEFNDYNKQMKIIICAILVTGSFVTAAFAGTPLIVGAVVTDMDEQGKDKVLGRFRILTEDGKQVAMPIGDMGYAVTPKLRADGTVDLVQTMTHHTDRGTVVTTGPHVQNQSLGESREIAFGAVSYATKVTKAK